MAVVIRPWFFLFFFFHLCACNQNIETFYPFTPPLSPSPSPNNHGTLFPPLQSPSPVISPSPAPKTSTDTTLVKAVAATAASTFVVATLLFFFIRKYLIARRREVGRVDNNPFRGGPVVLNNNFERSNGSFKGIIVDEDGLDVHYWRKLEEEIVKNNTLGYKKSFHKVFQSPEDDEEEKVVLRKVQELPLLLGKSSNSQKKVETETSSQHGKSYNSQTKVGTKSTGELSLTGLPSNSPIESVPAATPAPLPPLNPQSLTAVPKKQPPPPPPPPRNSAAIAQKAGPAAPSPPPPPPLKTSSAPPPPPLPLKKSSGSSGSSKLNEGMPAVSENGEATDENETAGAGNGQVKLKPLHWDKVNKNAEHSMVWDKIGGGSFRFDDDLMEALFGTVATNRKSPGGKSNFSVSDDSNQGQVSQIVILDARKSHNIAIVLKSLGISRRGLVDTLIDGEDLNADTLEKLMRIAPTKEEQAQILEFNGDPTSLADAESFLYHLLKDVPAAFTRLDTMLFRSNYDAEILQFKELLQTLELGCKELRNRGLFMKLLEAILKAGNRMNAGTARGNAQAFKLTSLRKLSDVKSTDGKTTLLHFVVEEVVRAEGKRCVLNRNRSLTRSSSISSNGSSTVSENSASKEEREKEYKKLGLPIVGGLSFAFTNVKKAAQIDYESFARTCSDLVARATQVRTNLSQCGSSKESNFVRVMKDFLESVEQELAVLKQEQMRIMDNVKKTTEYYQPGAFNDKETSPLHLFVIIKEFLGMVDQVCVEIARNLQRRKSSTSSVGSTPKSPATRIPVRFPNLPERFMKEKSRSNSSESGGDY